MNAIWDFIMAIINWIFGDGVSNDNTWKCPMFYPHQLNGTSGTPPWPGNRGVDSNQGYADHPVAWENERRINAFKWTQIYGGNAQMFIAENLYGHSEAKLELQMFLTNRKSPKDGHQMNDGENWIVKARAYGIQRWIVCLFNSPGSIIPVSARQDYVKQMCDCFDWATKDQVAFLVGLECNRNLSVAQVKEMCGWLQAYCGGKRIIVGSADAGFLKACSGNGVELWAESDQHPFDVNMSNADAYLAKLRDLQKYGKVWAGEWGDGCNMEVMKYITQKAIAMGCDCGAGYFK